MTDTELIDALAEAAMRKPLPKLTANAIHAAAWARVRSQTEISKRVPVGLNEFRPFYRAALREVIEVLLENRNGTI